MALPITHCGDVYRIFKIKHKSVWREYDKHISRCRILQLLMEYRWNNKFNNSSFSRWLTKVKVATGATKLLYNRFGVCDHKALHKWFLRKWKFSCHRIYRSEIIFNWWFLFSGYPSIWRNSREPISLMPEIKMVAVYQILFVFYVLDYPRYFTPNGDGYNDYWNIENLNLYQNRR
jgi:hypothetical protein